MAGELAQREFAVAALIAIRKRELGLDDRDAFARARRFATSATPSPSAAAMLVDIADTLPAAGSTERPTDVDVARRVAAYQHRDEYVARLAERADSDALSAYLWVAVSCSAASNSPGERALFDRIPTWRDTPLIAFRIALCRSDRADALSRLVASEPRFREVDYFIGTDDATAGRFADAVEAYRRAWAWKPAWTLVTNSLGSTCLALEEYKPAVEFFDRTIASDPQSPDALFGKARALVQLAEYDSALVALDRLLALGDSYVGEARYLRALSELELGQTDIAWNDVQLAERLIINADVKTLAGIVAYRRNELDVAVSEFRESERRDPNECEARFYMSLVMARKSVWKEAVDSGLEADSCLSSGSDRLRRDIEQIRTADIPADRKSGQIESRLRQVASNDRMLRTCWFNLAVAYFNLSRLDQAKRFADRVKDTPEYARRARDLLSRIR